MCSVIHVARKSVSRDPRHRDRDASGHPHIVATSALTVSGVSSANVGVDW